MTRTPTSAPDGDVLRRCRRGPGVSDGDGSYTRDLREDSVDDTWSNLLSQRTDTQLVLGLTNGSHDALAELYARHGGAMHGLALRMGGPSDADDVVQDVFFRLWHRPARFDPSRGSLRSFLLMQTRSRTIDVLRSDAARRSRETGRSNVVCAVSSPADDSALAHFEDEHVRALLSHLPETQRSAITLAYLGGYTYNEVAQMLDEPSGTVKSRIRSGLLRLRQTHINVDQKESETCG